MEYCISCNFSSFCTFFCDISQKNFTIFHDFCVVFSSFNVGAGFPSPSSKNFLSEILLRFQKSCETRQCLVFTIKEICTNCTHFCFFHQKTSRYFTIFACFSFLYPLQNLFFKELTSFISTVGLTLRLIPALS